MTDLFNPIRLSVAVVLMGAAVAGCTAPAPAGHAAAGYGAPAYPPTGYYNGFGEGSEGAEGNGMGEGNDGGY